MIVQPEKINSETGELRQDLITGKWVTIARRRAKHIADWVKKNKPPVPRKHYDPACVFCNLVEFPQAPDILRLPDDDDKWLMHIFANKYPAFMPGDEVRAANKGPYRTVSATGYHELLATRWHDQTESHISSGDLALLIEALVLRYRQLKTKPSVNYIQIIRNHGKLAGESQEHPHHQIFTTPVLPSDIHDMLHGAENYAERNDANPFTDILNYERNEGTRIVWENADFTLFCPFASKVPFETWIMPRRPEPFFENIGPDLRQSLAETMQQIFKRLYYGLNDVSYNYFIHSAPCDDSGFVCNENSFKHFRWHIKIMPRYGPSGGFELGTGLEINPSLPEESADFLRSVAIN